jgi:hypothetical protein
MLKYPLEDPCPTVLGGDDRLRKVHCLLPWGHDGVHWDGSLHHTIGAPQFLGTWQPPKQKSKAKGRR